MSDITVKKVIDNVDTNVLLARPLTDWRPILADEVNVFVFGENYVAKRFDQINFKFCEKNEAKEILIDNLYALLRYKYFPKSTEEIDERINKIVSSFTANLKTTLKKVSFDRSSDAEVVKMLPDYCVAFRNGVYNFKDDKWLFKYDIVKLPRISNSIYMYDNSYIIQWYLDYDFDSLGVKIFETDLKDEYKSFQKDQRGIEPPNEMVNRAVPKYARPLNGIFDPAPIDIVVPHPFVFPQRKFFVKTWPV